MRAPDWPLAKVPSLATATFSNNTVATAADYIVKPFSPTELVARVRAALRRHEARPSPSCSETSPSTSTAAA